MESDGFVGRGKMFNGSFGGEDKRVIEKERCSGWGVIDGEINDVF